MHSPAAGTFRGSNNWLSFCGNINETKLLSSAKGQAEQLLLHLGLPPRHIASTWAARAALDLARGIDAARVFAAHDWGDDRGPCKVALWRRRRRRF